MRTCREQPASCARGGATAVAGYREVTAAIARSNQEVQSDLVLMRARGLQIPECSPPSRWIVLGGLIYGLLRAELRDAGR